MLGSNPSRPMESQMLARPERFFEDRFGLSASALDRLLGSELAGRVDHADLFLEYRVSEELILEEGAVKKASRHVSQGAGIRAQSGERTGYAHTDDLALPNLEEAARQARAIADSASSSAVVAVGGGKPHDLYTLAETPITAALDRKVKLLGQVDAAARAADPRVRQVIASLGSEDVVVLIATPSGWTVGDVRPLTRLNVTVIVEENGKREMGGYGGGGRVPFDFFLEHERWRHYTSEAVRQAVIKLHAVAAPAGELTVVLGPGWPGILLHEAVGHGLEGDFNRKGTSAFSGRRGYMQDRLNARLMGMPATGNGRRESCAHPPMPRMTNTFMLAGQDDPADIIRSVPRGLYAVNFGGGQVDITNGKFVFSASEAYLIEDGQVTKAVKGATLIGNGPDALTRVSRVGHDLKLDEGVGTCGKDGQSGRAGAERPRRTRFSSRTRPSRRR